MDIYGSVLNALVPNLHVKPAHLIARYQTQNKSNEK